MTDKTEFDPAVLKEAFQHYFADLGDYAAIVGEIDPTILQHQVEIGHSHRGVRTGPGKWNDRTVSVNALTATLCTHRSGEKDGAAITCGALIGGQRKKNAVRSAHILGIDVDCGVGFDALLQSVNDQGLFCIAHTTHSHMRPYTDVAASAFDAWCERQGVDGDLQAVKQYLLDKKALLPEIATSAREFARQHAEDGIVYRVSHDPIPKARLFFLLKAPFVFAERGVTLAEAHAQWKQLILSVGALLGIPIDEACTDPSRLFYTPRHPAGARTFKSAVLFGDPLDADALLAEVAVAQPDAPAPASAQPKAVEKQVATVSGDHAPLYMPSGASMNKWAVLYADRFEPVTALLHHAPNEVGSETTGIVGRHIRCPFEEEHGNAGQADEATFAVNASDDPKGRFRIGCHHGSCKAAGRDRLDFLHQIVCIGALPESALTDPRFLIERDGLDLDAVKIAFPPPNRSHGIFGYREFDGRPWLYEMDQANMNDGPPPWERLFTPLVIEAGVIFMDQGGKRGLRIRLQDENQDVETIDVEAGLATRGYGVDLRAQLREAGVAMTDPGEKRIVQLVKQTQPRDPVEIYETPGWHGSLFLTPWGGVVNSNRNVELAASNMPAGEEKRGSLDGWLDATEAVFRCDVLHFQVGVLSAFVSPIVDLCRYPSPILAYTGQSSRGKSTAQKLQATPWGDPAPKKGLFGTFNGTIGASEALLQRASGAGYAFDEARMIDGRDLQTLVFKASSDGGADRLTRNADLRKARSWTLLVSISNETSLFQKIKDAGDNATTGLGTRSLDLNVEDAPTLDPATMKEIEAAFLHHGHAGAVAVQEMVRAGYVDDPDRLRIEIEGLVDVLVGPAGSPPMRRAARIAALIWKAGEIVQSARLIPQEFDLEAMAKRLWAKALEAETAPADTSALAIRTLFENLIKRRGVDVAEDASGGNREAMAWRLEDFKTFGEVYVIPTSALTKLSGGSLDHMAVAKALAKRGLLIPNRRKDKHANVWDFIPGLGKVRSVVVPAAVVEDEEHAEGAVAA